MVSTNSERRRRADLNMMQNCPNLYVSPDDYRVMRDVDKSKISMSMATAVFGYTLSQALKVLRASEGGQEVIRRVETKVRTGL